MLPCRGLKKCARRRCLKAQRRWQQHTADGRCARSCDHVQNVGQLAKSQTKQPHGLPAMIATGQQPATVRTVVRGHEAIGGSVAPSQNPSLRSSLRNQRSAVSLTVA